MAEEKKIYFRETKFERAKKIWGNIGVFQDEYKDGFKEKRFACVTAFLDRVPIAFSVKTFDKGILAYPYLSYTYVDKQYRRLGIARTLTERMLTYGDFTLEISPMNLVSLAAHIRMGFEIVELNLNHDIEGFKDISNKNSYYKAGTNFRVPIEECLLVNELFKNCGIDKIKFFNNRRPFRKVGSPRYRYYAGMYHLKCKR